MIADVGVSGANRPEAATGPAPEAGSPSLLAVSDLHVGHAQNRPLVENLTPRSDADWLIVAGDVGEFVADIEWALGVLSDRFAKVIWVPGNHELWTHPKDPSQLRGVERYEHLVAMCRRLGVATPEDPYPIWDTGPGGAPVTVAPLFILYDYTFRPDGASTKAEALEQAYATGIVCTDEMVLHPDPYPSIDAWCEARLELTERRLTELPPGTQTILVNHFPLVREPTRVLRYPVFAQWCGTERTADWPVRFRAAAVVYGHLHIPRTIWHDGVRHVEVSLGYPREWQRRDRPPRIPRQILPD
jgi:3',5'-cyclic AMP phosphodiesterase CpdA